MHIYISVNVPELAQRLFFICCPWTMLNLFSKDKQKLHKCYYTNFVNKNITINANNKNKTGMLQHNHHKNYIK